MEGAIFQDVPVMKTRENCTETQDITFPDNGIYFHNFQKFLGLVLFSKVDSGVQKCILLHRNMVIKYYQSFLLLFTPVKTDPLNTSRDGFPAKIAGKTLARPIN